MRPTGRNCDTSARVWKDAGHSKAVTGDELGAAGTALKLGCAGSVRGEGAPKGDETAGQGSRGNRETTASCSPGCRVHQGQLTLQTPFSPWRSVVTLARTMLVSDRHWVLLPQGGNGRGGRRRAPTTPRGPWPTEGTPEAQGGVCCSPSVSRETQLQLCGWREGSGCPGTSGVLERAPRARVSGKPSLGAGRSPGVTGAGVWACLVVGG